MKHGPGMASAVEAVPVACRRPAVVGRRSAVADCLASLFLNVYTGCNGVAAGGKDCDFAVLAFPSVASVVKVLKLAFTFLLPAEGPGTPWIRG